jgi:hypothetical protein
MLTIDGLVKIRFGRFRDPPQADQIQGIAVFQGRDYTYTMSIP